MGELATVVAKGYYYERIRVETGLNERTIANILNHTEDGNLHPFFAKNDASPLIIREGTGGALSITFDTVNIDRCLNKNKTMDVDKIVCCD